MDGETVETVTGWESEPLSGGTDGLRTLQSREFTGAVTEGHAWLFMLNGRVVGVFDGSLDSLTDADGTAYAAPDPSLSLLFAMRERGGETKARYYTNDTALSAADAKLSSGKFTGYIELSENVLSGDYYAVYYGGRRLACAFVGTGEQKQVLTGEEAFDAAAGEVGIYEVVDVDVDVVDIPEPDPKADPDPTPDEGAAAPPAGPTGAEGGAPAASDEDASAGDTATSITFGGAGGSSDADESAATAGTASGDDADPGATAAANPAAADASAPDSDAPDAPTDDERTGTSPTAADEQATDAVATGRPADSAVTPAAVSDATVARDGADDETQTGSTSQRDAADATEPAAPARDGNVGSEPTGDGDPFSAEEQWRETRSIPSLDPAQTTTEDSDEPRGGDPAAAERRRRRDRSAHDRGSRTPDADAETDTTAGGRSSVDRRDAASPRDGVADAGAELAAAREALATARAERDRALEGAREARDKLESNEDERAQLREENARLTDRVEELESQFAEAREELAAARDRAGSGDGAPARTIPPERALAGTNLFVRYDSKGGATLSKAHAGGTGRSDVNDNLRLEVHTDFDADDAAVDGQPFREYLIDTIEYGFVEWAVRELLYEIQSTGNESALRDLFDAIPEIDRAELNGAVTLDGNDGDATEHTFDVVLRDRMGNPLLVADVTEGRDATTESMLDGLVGDASAVADADDHLVAGFYVTASFFEPGALEAAADATGGGLLSRGKRKSFVKLSRKRGFHLCLVESREGEYHVNVPEL